MHLESDSQVKFIQWLHEESSNRRRSRQALYTDDFEHLPSIQQETHNQILFAAPEQRLENGPGLLGSSQSYERAWPLRVWGPMWLLNAEGDRAVWVELVSDIHGEVSLTPASYEDKKLDIEEVATKHLSVVGWGHCNLYVQYMNRCAR